MIVVKTSVLGFCYGVRRAVGIAENALRQGPVVMLGALIHNPQEIRRLAEKGARIVSDPSDVRAGDAVLIRGHGVPPGMLDRLAGIGARVVDATCPIVASSQMKAHAAARGGYRVIIAGARDHPEVAGLMGWAGPESIAVVSAGDVRVLPVPPDGRRMVLMAQTTIDRVLWSNVVSAVRERFPDVRVLDTLCPAVSERIEAARALAEDCDGMLVVGGHGSANTKALVCACAEGCGRVWQTETYTGIPFGEISRCDKLGITAGTSTPDWIIEEVVRGMSDMERSGVENASIPQETEPQETAGATEIISTPTPEVSAAEAEAPTPAEASDEDGGAGAVGESFAQAFEKTMVTIRPGQTVKGTVVLITEDEVCVNIGYKVDGVVKKEELTDDIAGLKLGDEIEVDVVKVNDGEGNVVCSQRNIVTRRNMEILIQKYENKELIDGVGKEVVKGGLIADVMGIRTFIPASQVAERYIEKLDHFVGKPMQLKIIEVDRSKRRLVASRKQALVEAAAARKALIWDKLEVGAKVHGTIRRLTDFGAFADIGGVDGLVHVTDLSWGRVRHPSDVVRVGDELDLLILALDHEKERISLGLKQTRPRPWDVAKENYPIGAIFSGAVVRIVTFGAFIELEPGLDGLVHISQIAQQRINSVEDALQVGDIVNVKVLDVNPEQKRISLSIRQAYEELGYLEDAEAQSEGDATAYSDAATTTIGDYMEGLASPEAADEEDTTQG